MLVRGYFKPPNIGGTDRDELVEPDRTSIDCAFLFFGTIVVGVLGLALLFVAMWGLIGDR
jgi:hypothetical protein